jgi:branched-subunit amino acid aminotransferase/4-amino-4-deoxychorismate lyase
MANLVLSLEGRTVTPPIRSGLLGGTFRGLLVESGAIEEAVLRVEDLQHADNVELINSVRRWIPAILVS